MIDYKRELESAAKGMILIHKPETLIRMIVRMMVRKVGVTHAGIILHHKDKNTYILTVSRGKPGHKIPAGFARVDPDNPLITYIIENRRTKPSDGVIIYAHLNWLIKNTKNKIAAGNLRKIKSQMEIFAGEVLIPSFFDDRLLAVLILGSKLNKRDFKEDEINFFLALANDVAMAISNAQLFQELQAELGRKQRLFIHTTVALAAAIDAKDHYTHGHTERVTQLSLQIAKKLMSWHKNRFSHEFLENLHIASLLHDIGKIGVPEAILNKQGPLNHEERKKIEEHPLIGTVILSPIQELEQPLQGVKYHHERYDGSGYPDGLKGDKIPLIAAIISVADAFDAMTTNRPYRPALTDAQAIEELKNNSGKQFNPILVQAMAELYKEGAL